MSGVEFGDGPRRLGVFQGLADQADMPFGEFLRAVDTAGVDAAVKSAAMRAHRRNKVAYRRNPQGTMTRIEAIRRQVELMARYP